MKSRTEEEMVHTVDAAEASSSGLRAELRGDENPEGYVLTLANEAEARAAERKSPGSDGSGRLMDGLRKHPLAVAEYDAETLHPTKRMPHRRKYWFDTANLYRIDGTNFCRWAGRASDGYFHSFGRYLEIVHRADGASSQNETPDAATGAQATEGMPSHDL